MVFSPEENVPGLVPDAIPQTPGQWESFVAGSWVSMDRCEILESVNN
jgi:hypothetical protein